MGSGGEMQAADVWDEMMEDWDETIASELVMCSTCSGFVMRKERADPDEDVVEVVTEAEKMRDLRKAVLLHGPLQELEPAEATKEQCQILRRRRMIMMETKMCPACFRSVLEMCPTCSRSNPELAKAVVADSGSKDGSKDSKRSRECSDGSSSGLKKKKNKKKVKSSGSEKFLSSEMERFGAAQEVKMEGFPAQEVKMPTGRNGKTKMVTVRLDKKSIDEFLRVLPPVKPVTYATNISLIQIMFANSIAKYEVDCEFHDYLRCQSIIRGYAEYQLEVSDGEDE